MQPKDNNIAANIQEYIEKEYKYEPETLLPAAQDAINYK
jgi:hypothetical protein